MQSELEAAKQAADQAKAQARRKDTPISTQSSRKRRSTKELQTKLDQATSESEIAHSQLKDKQSELEGVQSELEAAKQAADQAKALAMDFAKSFASLNSELEDANAQLAVSYTKVGDVLMAQGNLAEALKSYRDGLAVADRLTKANPGNAELAARSRDQPRPRWRRARQARRRVTRARHVATGAGHHRTARGAITG